VKGQLDTFRDREIFLLQRQIDYLNTKVSPDAFSNTSPGTGKIHSEEERSPAANGRGWLASATSTDLHSSPLGPQFHGHTSSEYDFTVAKSSLRWMGIHRDHNDGDTVPPLNRVLSRTLPSPAAMEADVMWHVSREDALRYVYLYQEDCSLLYPVVDVRQIATQVDRLWSSMGAGRTISQFQGFSSEHQLDIIRLILAIGLLLDNKESSTQTATEIYSNMEAEISLKILQVPTLDLVALAVLIVS
jgi:hypothetical protein